MAVRMLLVVVALAAACGCGKDRHCGSPVDPGNGDTTSVPADTLSLRELSGRRNLTSQADVDSLAAAGGAVYRLDGSLLIRGSADSLVALRGLRRVTGDLELSWNPSLGALTGLAGVDSVGGSLRIQGNDRLADLAGLGGLRYLGGDLVITQNATLTSCEGLGDSLRSLGGDVRVHANPLLPDLRGLGGLRRIGGDLMVTGNAALTSFGGLDDSLAVDGDLLVFSNPSLTFTAIDALARRLRSRGFDGRVVTSADSAAMPPRDGVLAGVQILRRQADLESFTRNADTTFVVRGGLFVEGEVTSLLPLRGLTAVDGSVHIRQTARLVRLDGLERLARVGGDLTIADNPALADLSALAALGTVGGSLVVERNRTLGDLAGLEGLSVMGGQVRVHSNGSLADSIVQAFGQGLRERGFPGTFSSGQNGGRSAGAIAFADPRFELGARAALGRYDNLPLFWEELQRVRSLTVQQASSLADLALFLELRRLTLSQPSATDYSGIAACTGLESLAISGADLREVPWISGMTGLRSLALPGSAIRDLSALASLSQLDTLDLQGNQIVDASPIRDLHFLRAVNLDNNLIEDLAGLPAAMRKGTLSLPDNRVSDLTPLADMPEVTALVLPRNQVADLTPLARTPWLTLIDLTANRVSDLGPIARVTALVWLGLADNQIADLSPLVSIRSLSGLKLSGNQITDLTPLAGLRVRDLGLAHNRIADVSPLLSMRHDWVPDQTMPYMVSLEGNPLSLASWRVHLPALLAVSGMRVTYDIESAPRNALTGRVVREDGTPLPGAAVRLRRVRDRDTSTDATRESATDGEGWYGFDELTWGSYAIAPRLAGYTFAPDLMVVPVAADSAVTAPTLVARPGASASPYTLPPAITMVAPMGRTHELLLVPAGDFLMGWADQLHTVYVDAFYIDRHQTTNAHWVPYNRYQEPGMHAHDLSVPVLGPPQEPVMYMTAGLGAGYCDWAGMHLPSEAEWEKAARGTDGRPYPWGWDPPVLAAAPGRLMPDYPPSPYGVEGMVDGVSEHVTDYFGDPTECCGEHTIKGNGTAWARQRGGGTDYSDPYTGCRCVLSAASVLRVMP